MMTHPTEYQRLLAAAAWAQAHLDDPNSNLEFKRALAHFVDAAKDLACFF